MRWAPRDHVGVAVVVEKGVDVREPVGRRRVACDGEQCGVKRLRFEGERAWGFVEHCGGFLLLVEGLGVEAVDKADVIVGDVAAPGHDFECRDDLIEAADLQCVLYPRSLDVSGVSLSLSF